MAFTGASDIICLRSDDNKVDEAVLWRLGERGPAPMGLDEPEFVLTVRNAFFHNCFPMDGLVGLEGVFGGLLGVADPMVDDMAGESSGEEAPVSEVRRWPIIEGAIFSSSESIVIGSQFSMSPTFSPSLDMIFSAIDLTL